MDDKNITLENDDERQKKIEAGKQKLQQFKKRKRKVQKATLKEDMPEIQKSDSSHSITELPDVSEDQFEEDMHISSNEEIMLDESVVFNLPIVVEKFQKYQQENQQCKDIIKQLSSQLNLLIEKVEKQKATSSEGCLEVEKVKEEFYVLRTQVLNKSLEDTKSEIAIKSTEDISIQTDKNILLIENSSQFEETECIESCNIESHPLNMETLLREKSELQAKIAELTNSKVNSSRNYDSAIIPSASSIDTESKSHEMRLLKKLTALNTIGKLVESLLSSSGNFSNSLEFTPSKFQKLFLNRLDSNETNETLTDTSTISDTENQLFDINYAEMTLNSEKRLSQSVSQSVEKLRNINISEDFSCMTQYFQVEKDFICLEFEALANALKSDPIHGSQSDENVIDLLPDAEAHGEEVPMESCAMEDSIGTVYEHIIQEKCKLEERLKYFDQLDKKLQESERNERQKSVESDNFICSEDNLLMEQPALSCLSLVSLTDSECKIECLDNNAADFTDSEANPSRRMSSCYGDAPRSIQERESCTNCKRFSVTLRDFEETIKSFENEKHNLKSSKETIMNKMSKQIEENEMHLKQIEEERVNQLKQIEEERVNQLNQIKELQEKLSNYEANMDEQIRNFEYEKQHLMSDTRNLSEEMAKQIEMLRIENETQLKDLNICHSEEVKKLKDLYDICHKEKEELFIKTKLLNDDVGVLNKRINQITEDKAAIEFRLQNEIADLIQDHQQDLDTVEKSKLDCLNQERKNIEYEFSSSVESLKIAYDDQINELNKKSLEKEENLILEHNKTLCMLEAAHAEEVKKYEEKIKELLEEKCQLLTKTSDDYERILKKNHKTLVNLCTQLLAQIKGERDRIGIDVSEKESLEVSFSDTLNNLSLRIENGIHKFLNYNYFTNTGEDLFEDETQYLEFENKSSADSTFIEDQITNAVQEQKKSVEHQKDSSFNFDDMQKLYSEIDKLQEEFEKDVKMYKSINQEQSDKLHILTNQVSELEELKEKLEQKLAEKEKVLVEKEVQISSSTMSLNHAAQTNSRLLHVLSDLVKTFLDIESDINTHLLEHGLIQSPMGNLIPHDDEAGQNVGSREDFTSLNLCEGPNLDLTEDGLDLTPRAWDLFSSLGAYDADTEGEDVVLGASRRLRQAVDHLLNFLTRAIDSHQNQDLKVLLKRNEELSAELQMESDSRETEQYELLNAKGLIRKHEMEKQKLEDSVLHLAESEALLKKELCSEKNKLSRIMEEKDSVLNEIHVLKEQNEILASRLGDPEKKLLQENSKLSSEKQVIQKHYSKEKQSLLDRLHQMEAALDELTAEKEDILEKKCKEIKDLKAEMESMEKQCQSNKKFIEEQASEREQEREEFMKELSKLEEFVREKEKIQSNEERLTKEIETAEHELRKSIEERKTALMKKEEAEKNLRQALEKIRDQGEIIYSLEKDLEGKSKREKDLNHELTRIKESASTQERNNLTLKEKLVQSQTDNVISGDSVEQLRDLEERLASRTEEIAQMSQNQTLLQELRGQIHFLEAKVDQRARQLEAGHLISVALSPSHSDDTSQSESQDGEMLLIPCEDGWEMSPRSVNWLEIRRLEEKISRLMLIDEELIKRNRDFELQLKKLRVSEEENHHEKVALQEKVSEQVLQITKLKSCLDEQKHVVPVHYVKPSMLEMEKLRHGFELEVEKCKRTMLELQETQDMLRNYKEQILTKDAVIVSLQNNISLLSKEMHEDKKMAETPCDENDASFSSINNLMIADKNEHIDSLTREVEYLKNELDQLKSDNLYLALEESKTQLIVKEEELEKEQQKNKNLTEQVSLLEVQIASLEATIQRAEEQIELGKTQVETLLMEMGNKNPIVNCNLETEVNESCIQCNSNEQLEMFKNQLREKNLEILDLREKVFELETSLQGTERELEFEQVQVGTLLKEIDSLTSYQKRLGQDFNTVQKMMQQKERELEVLQEESDAQMRLESKLETLEQVITDQKKIERELQEKVIKLERIIENYNKSSKEEKDNFLLQIEQLSKKHLAETNGFRKRIQILSRKLKSLLNEDVEDLDIEEVRNQLVEAAETFNNSDNESKEAFSQLTYIILKKAVDTKMNNLQKSHKDTVDVLNKNWQQKVNEEISLHKNTLLKKFNEDVAKAKQEKDTFWQKKLNEKENSLQAKHENLSKTAQDLEKVLEDTYKEMDSLKADIKNISKENSSIKKSNEELKTREQNLLQLHKNEKDRYFKEFKTRLQSAEDEMMVKYNQQKIKLESSYRNQADKLQIELNSKLENEKSALEARHKQELSDVHKFFENRWAEEIKKFHLLQLEDIKKLKDSKEKGIEEVCNHLFSVYEDKLNKIRKECEMQIVEERKAHYVKHQAEVQRLQNVLEARFVKAKEDILISKEKELQAIREELERKYDKNLLEKRDFMSLPENMDFEKQNWKRMWEKEKLELVNLHRNEIFKLKEEFERRCDTRVQAREAEMRKVEESYNSQLEDARKLLKEASRLAAIGSRSNSSAARSPTPSSDITTSSDETCSSCREDALPTNKHHLVNKIHQDGKKVLSLIESKKRSSSAEANQWLEEREWVINQLRNLSKGTEGNQTDVKQMIACLIHEIESSRKEIGSVYEKEKEIQDQFVQLRHQISVQSSKNNELASHLMSQKTVIQELEALLAATRSELDELKRRISTKNREQMSLLSNEKEYPQSFQGSGDASRGCFSEIEVGRSADTQRSESKFSLYLPEISPLQKVPQTDQRSWKNVAPILSPPSLPTRLLEEKESPIQLMQKANFVAPNVEQSVRTPNGKNMYSTTEAKFHCLFWRYKRSQSYQKALTYQKIYLLSLLKGFQATEKVTLTWLNLMGNKGDSLSSDSPLRGKSLFKSAAFVIIAVARMKFLVRFWQQRAKFPTTKIISNEVESVLVNHPFLFSSADRYMSSNISTSKSTSLDECGSQSRSNQILSDSGSGIKDDSQRKTKMEKQQMIEYVYRLENLHKQLGLQDILSVPLSSSSNSTNGS